MAAGLVPFALGSETSGSIISPSASCGVTGLRPTYGLVSRHGAMTLAWSLDKVGPMAHSAEDCALVLEAIAGADRRDDTSARRTFRYAPLPPAELRRLRLGFAPADFDEVAAEVSENYKLRRPVKFNARRCGEANAYYDPDTIEIIFCYELMQDFMELYAAELPDPVEPAPRPSGAGKVKGDIN